MVFRQPSFQKLMKIKKRKVSGCAMKNILIGLLTVKIFKGWQSCNLAKTPLLVKATQVLLHLIFPLEEK